MLRSYNDIVWALIETIVVISVAGYLYSRFVRPLLLSHGLLDFEARWFAKLKQHWDVTGAVAIAALAGSWNSILDGLVLVAQAFPDVLEKFNGMDLTGVWMPEWLRGLIQIGCAMLPIIRVLVLILSTKPKEG